MNPPFTSEQFFAVFAAYNSSVWPMQVLLWLMALAAIILAVRPSRFSERKIPKYILVIPLIWSFIGFNAALQWKMLEDIMLPVAGLSATLMLFARDRKG